MGFGEEDIFCLVFGGVLVAEVDLRVVRVGGGFLELVVIFFGDD